MVGLAACLSKTNKQARLVERRVCLISDASNWRGAGSGYLCKSQLHPYPLKSRGESFYRQSVSCRNSTVISNSHLQIDHEWSDQPHLEWSQ